MNQKVSLREIVGTKIVYALILALYYWMWARTDWKDWYTSAQNVLGLILAGFFFFQGRRIKRYKQEGFDEMAEQNLKRVDSISLKVFIVFMIGLAWACAILSHVHPIPLEIIGWIIIASILLLSIIRTILFVIMDRKGV